jgi:mono/diheme cytochrome c family protein
VRLSHALSAATVAVLVFIVGPQDAYGVDGKAIVADQCTSCHNVIGPAPKTFEAILKRRAPDLFYAGSKFNRSWLVEWLQNPTPIRQAGVVYLNHIATRNGKDGIAVDSVKPCAVKLSPEAAAETANYLMTLKDKSIKTGIIDPAKGFSKPKAVRLFRKQLPCVGCHTVKWGKRVIGGISGPNLSGAGKRLNPDWVYARIENPQYWDPKTWMPGIEMSHTKRELLTLFIASMKSPAKQDLKASGVAVPGTAIPLTKFVAPSGTAHRSADKNYRLHCVQCHGSQGNGRGINDSAGGLSVSPKDHVSAEDMSKLSDEEIKLAVTKGGDAVEKSGLMPPWGNTLSSAEIDEIVLYLRQLCLCVGAQ